MKTLIRLLILTLLIAPVLNSSAQSFGVKAGLNMANLMAKDDFDNYNDELKMLYGFHAGVFAEVPANDFFSFEPGLFISRKGTRVEEEFGSYSYRATMSLYYLDIPLNGKFTFDAGNVKLYGKLGPYIGVGLKGKLKEVETFDDGEDTYTYDIEWGEKDSDADFRRFDVGLNAGAGIEFHSVLVELNYGLGLYNISTYSDDGFKENNRVLGISVGYKFWNK